MLKRIFQGVAEGNRAGAVPPLPSRGNVGYQGGGSDLVARFCQELTALGAFPHVVADIEGAVRKVVKLVLGIKASPSPPAPLPETGRGETGRRRVLLGGGSVLDRLDLESRLKDLGFVVHVVDAIEPGREKEIFFQADVGVSGVAWAIAETGTMVMASGRNDPRSLSLTPPVHIAVVGRDQILPDLFDFFAKWDPDKMNLPACLSLISGPSKTGDIELKLVTGVHGPGEVHAIVIE